MSVYNYWSTAHTCTYQSLVYYTVKLAIPGGTIAVFPSYIHELLV